MPPKSSPAKKKKAKREEVKIPKELAEQMPPEKLKQSVTLFHKIDKKAEGLIDVKELGYMLRFLGGNPTDAEIAEWTDSIRLEHDKMNLLGFLRATSQELLTHKSEEEIIAAFKLFDKKDNGLVESKLMRAKLTDTGEILPPDVAGLFIDEAGPMSNADGEIRYSDFLVKMGFDANKAFEKKAKTLGLLEKNTKKSKKSKKKK